MKYTFLISIFVFAGILCNAQGKVVFSSQNYAGLLIGETETSYQVQTINGIKYKTWFGGIGLGIDGYYDRSVPLFASVSKDIFKKKSGVYLSADCGINFGWATADQKRTTESNFDPGLYWAGGLGYKIAIGKTNGLLFYTGYSSKHLIENVTTYPADAPQVDRYDYHLRRISLKIGWSF